ncbi:MAG: prepilin-type N-terminal cleavage/methylation domain-containing protein [Thermoguttaceae bacterium]|nr:prepilin-type N-terminal cleavage/methylation domain-containing protein [Thermoguttaceae bacterium]
MTRVRELSGVRSSAKGVRPGFTLVEILAVIGIIGLLAAATLVALGGTRGFFRSVTAKARLDDVSQALELYKQKYGEYPPDCNATDAEIQRHILKRWPKVLKAGNVKAMVGYARDEMHRAPGSAPLFWLAGRTLVKLDESDPSSPLVFVTAPVAGGGPEVPVYEGFYADPVDPFGITAPGSEQSRDEPLIDVVYDSEGSGRGNYNENGFCFNGQPMAYFRAGKDGYAGKGYCAEAFGIEEGTEGGDAMPYMKNGRWYNPKTFQLILPGADGQFGLDFEMHQGDEPLVRDLALPDTMSSFDWDNLTNFTEGATLDSEKD